MNDLIDSILIGSCATYLPIWTWSGSFNHFWGAVAFSMGMYMLKRWNVWKEEMMDD